MKLKPNALKKWTFILVYSCLTVVNYNCQEKQYESEKVTLLRQKLSDLSDNEENTFFEVHMVSILRLIQSEQPFSHTENELLEAMYEVFLNDSLANPSELRSYENRKRKIIVSWVSPTDSVISFSWLRLPKNWDLEKEYPLYVNLHGSWDVASSRIRYLSYPFIEKPVTSTAFEDGYTLEPWGRGNQWYHGISKTDIWECINEFEKIAKVDPNRKYLSGHSMGGYGTWHIAQESANTWAAIGLHSAALWYKNEKYITPDYATNLKNIPTYFVWGNAENNQMKTSNLKAHKLLENVGNQNLKITTFNGGHDYNQIDVEDMYDWMRTFEKKSND